MYDRTTSERAGRRLRPESNKYAFVAPKENAHEHKCYDVRSIHPRPGCFVSSEFVEALTTADQEKKEKTG